MLTTITLLTEIFNKFDTKRTISLHKIDEQLCQVSYAVFTAYKVINLVSDLLKPWRKENPSMLKPKSKDRAQTMPKRVNPFVKVRNKLWPSFPHACQKGPGKHNYTQFVEVMAGSK